MTTCFACSEPATRTVRQTLDSSTDGVADACDQHRDPATWTQRTSALFASVARRVQHGWRDAAEDIAEDLIDEALS
jgi:hypothetical protein